MTGEATATASALPSDRTDGDLEDAAHVLLQLGRLFLVNGADTERVHHVVADVAARFGCEAHLTVTYEALLLTVSRGTRFRTRVGAHVPALGVNLGAIERLNAVLDALDAGAIDRAGVAARLAAIEAGTPTWPRAATALALGVTAASLVRLFGGDWAASTAALVAGSVGTWARLAMAERHWSPLLVTFLTALFSGALGAAGARLGGTATPALCLVAPGMILVPGVPFINGIRDVIRNHMTFGLARLAFAGLLTLAIAVGLVTVTRLSGVVIPLDAAPQGPPLLEDALFSALAAIGYALLFGVPSRLLWACMLCGLASHALRSALGLAGVGLVPGSFVAAAVAGVLAQLWARRFRVPPVAFVFPGVVAMVPGAYAFRVVVGAVGIMQAGAAAPAAQIAETLGLLVETAGMVVAIGIGVAVPLALLDTRRR